MKGYIIIGLMLTLMLIPTASAQCTSWCELGDVRCGGQNGAFKVPCGDYNSDGCFEWGPQELWIFCPTGCIDPIGEPAYCSGDGPPQKVCGDGICSPEVGETVYNCPQDCEYVGQICGNGVCEGFEFITCPQDCTEDPITCGDGICEGSEYITCPQDCGQIPEPCTNYCALGDWRCGGVGGNYKIPCADDNLDGCFEWSQYNHQFCDYGCTDSPLLPASCNLQPTMCHDTDGTDTNTKGTVTYDYQEYVDYCVDSVTILEYYCLTPTVYASFYRFCDYSCSDGRCTDTPITYCGDGNCDSNENYQTCPQDCYQAPYCGDGICQSGETSQNCPQDCGVPPQPFGFEILLITMLISALITVAIFFLTPIKNWIALLIIWIILTVILMFIFAAPIATIASMV